MRFESKSLLCKQGLAATQRIFVCLVKEYIVLLISPITMNLAVPNYRNHNCIYLLGINKFWLVNFWKIVFNMKGKIWLPFFYSHTQYVYSMKCFKILT